VCGICGIASSRGPADRNALAALSASLGHGRPDSAGIYVDGGVGLAARNGARLAEVVA